MSKILFSTENLGKTYGNTVALQGITIHINEGEVVGLVGENGAGKSTLMKQIMGVEQPTEGKMFMQGKPYAPRNPKEANKAGVGMVFQEQSLITNLSVGQNIFFGDEARYRKFGLINWNKMYGDAEKALVGFSDVKPRTKVMELDFVERQMIEIAKVLNGAKTGKHERSLILLDEPTSVLNDDEIEKMFNAISEIRAEGNAVIFVSHRLDEVIRISDRVYVFKDGQEVGLFNKEEVNEDTIYERMVGRTSSGEYYKLDRQRLPEDDIVLEVRDLGCMGEFKNVSFQLKKGEILGICGVVGSGKESLCSTICGEIPYDHGEMLINGKNKKFRSPYEALESGILSIPQERREEGIIGMMSIYNNISVSNLSAVKKMGLISIKKQRDQANKWIKRLNIKCPGCDEPISRLSGGNAQKVVFSRLLASGAKICVLNHPTRGVDVGAKEEIYSLIRDTVNAGISVIILGDTLDECIGLSNRVLVMKDGLVKKEFTAEADKKPEQLDILKYMM